MEVRPAGMDSAGETMEGGAIGPGKYLDFAKIDALVPGVVFLLHLLDGYGLAAFAVVAQQH